MKIKIKNKWLRLSEESNALDYLEQAYNYMIRTEKDKNAWKWVIITLHDALYGFAICACKGTNTENVVKKNRKGDERLISFYEALGRCKSNKYLHLSKQQDDSIDKIKEFRDNFAHYIPAGWLIEIHGMPQITLDALSVIRFLSIDTDNYHLTQNQKRRIKSIVFRSNLILKKCKLYKEAKLIEDAT